MIRGEEGASNPTLVDSTQISCGSGEPLKNGAMVTFANIQFEFYQKE